MNDRFDLNDALIRVALSPATLTVAEDLAVEALADAIRGRIDDRPSRRSWWSSLELIGAPGLRPGLGRQALFVLLVLAITVALLVAVVGTRRPPIELGDGSQFHGGATRTGQMIGPGPVAPPTQLWTLQLDGGLQNTMPALGEGRLFVADGRGNIGVHDLTTGAAGWGRSLALPATSPAVADGILVIGAGDGLYGIDETSGAIRWSIASEREVSSAPAVVAGVAYAGFPEGTVVAVDVRTGAVLWRAPVGGSISRAVAVATGIVYAGDDTGQLHALDAADGRVMWSKDIGAGALSTPAVSDGMVVAGTGLGDGQAKHQVVALDAQTGDPRWTFPAPQGGELVIGGARGDVVYAVGLDGWVYAVRDGVSFWQFDTGGPIGSVGTIYGGLLYISSSIGHIVALDIEGGTRVWSVSVDGDPGPVVVADGRMYLGTALGQLVAFGPAP